ncbi:UNVERIFIED_CONTAM: hypothetical protein GTU68_043127 [Idotea baltica]|nr:hypothetical protein [Idotea baltica]
MGFAAYSGTGKTTLLSKVIPLLTEKGYRIGIIKHTHHNIDIDKPGKDSHVLRESGAAQTVIASRNRTAMIIEKPDAKGEPILEDALSNLQTGSLDLVLVEGFKAAKFSKIELHRDALGKPYMYPKDDNIVAIATDHEINEALSIPHLDMNQPHQIADFIEQKLLEMCPTLRAQKNYS